MIIQNNITHSNSYKPELLFDLLNRIYSYYPIGMPNLNQSYPGYNKLLAILQNKINNLIEKNDGPWEQFVNSVESKIAFVIRNESYHQFPSYVLRIEIINKESNELLIVKNIYLFISLLTNHYTFYIRQDLGFAGLSTNPNRSEILFSRFYSKGTKDEIEIIEILENEISTYFQTFQYAPHKLLFDYKITGGLPHGEIIDAKNDFSVFYFLFGMSDGSPMIHIQD